MTSRDSYVDDAPPIDHGDHFERWLDITSSPARFETPVHRARENKALALSSEPDPGYPRRLELSIDSRRSRVLDWLLSRRVRRAALTITTCGVLAFGAWLLANELAPSAGPAVDFSAFAPGGDSAESAIQSTSAEIEPAVEQVPVPMLSSDGRVNLNVTTTDGGWATTVRQTEGSFNDDVQASAVRLLVNGEVITESAGLPLNFAIESAGTEGDVATLIVSAIVDWSNGTSSPVSVAVADLG